MRAMGTVKIQIPLVTWRDGRPRFWPSAAQRAMGYKGEDLRHGKSGPWFTLEEAIAWSKRREAELADKRGAIAAGETTAKKVGTELARRRRDGLVSVGHVLTAYRDLNPRMLGVAVIDGRRKRKPLAAATARGYRGAIRLIEQFDDGEVWAARADELTPAALGGILEKFEAQHGLAMTRLLRATLSVAFGWAMGRAGKFMVRRNPVADLEETLPVLAPRVRYGTVPEMVHLLAVADCLDFFDVGDMFLTGLYTGQRQADRLALEDVQISAAGIRFMQRKKGGQPLLIPPVDDLKARLEAAATRRQDWRLNYPHVHIDERLRRPWLEDRYRKLFRIVRHAAAFGSLAGLDKKTAQLARAELRGKDVAQRLAAAGLAPMASLADFRDQDLRDTAVTWLALAGCTKWEVAAITGHGLKSIDGILSHYFGLHPELARSATAKLQAWRKAHRGDELPHSRTDLSAGDRHDRQDAGDRQRGQRHLPQSGLHQLVSGQPGGDRLAQGHGLRLHGAGSAAHRPLPRLPGRRPSGSQPDVHPAHRRSAQPLAAPRPPA